eukprot:g904.t1
MRKLPELSTHYQDPHRYPQGIAYQDGQYLPVAEAKVSVLDYGFLHSDATYDVAHVWEGAFFRLDDHLERFFRGMAELHMSISLSKADITDILHTCVALSGLKNAYVEFICTRGTSPSFSRDPRDAENRFLAFVIPFGSVANPDQLKRGLDLAVTDILRIPPGSVDPTVKNYHWLDMVKGLYQAYERGAETAVLHNGAGHIAEGPGFNVFAVKDGAVITPPTGVLLGITRQTVFDICARLSLPCAAASVSVEALSSADEVFITSTAGGVMPVGRIDGKTVGTGGVGPITSRIMETYWQMHGEGPYRSVVAYPD